MEKRGVYQTGWRHRHFALLPTRIEYRRSRTDVVPAGEHGGEVRGRGVSWRWQVVLTFAEPRLCTSEPTWIVVGQPSRRTSPQPPPTSGKIELRDASATIVQGKKNQPYLEIASPLQARVYMIRASLPTLERTWGWETKSRWGLYLLCVLDLFPHVHFEGWAEKVRERVAAITAASAATPSDSQLRRDATTTSGALPQRPTTLLTAPEIDAAAATTATMPAAPPANPGQAFSPALHLDVLKSGWLEKQGERMYRRICCLAITFILLLPQASTTKSGGDGFLCCVWADLNIFPRPKSATLNRSAPLHWLKAVPTSQTATPQPTRLGGDIEREIWLVNLG